MLEYSRLVNSFENRKKWNEMSENELWEELCLCILSSNVPYELACSAFFHLRKMRLLNPKWITKSSNAAEQIAYELSRPIFLPKKKDGSYRKYRFPNLRARNIVSAARTLYLKNFGILKLLRRLNSENEVRDFLVKNIAGIGFKEASHFLRNIGYSDSLAIIDSHVITFLKEVKIMPSEKVKTVTPKIYMKLEKILQDLCKRLDLNLAVFDMAIWRYMRGK